MEDYIAGNKAAWEEAFDKRDASYGADVARRVQTEPYAFFQPELAEKLREMDLRGKTVGQYCCNNGRELLSLVKSAQAARGVGFDIAENMVLFAQQTAEALALPCTFVATDVYAVGETYAEQFDLVVLTIGALCWLKDLDRFFAIVSGSMKPGATILVHEQHPFTNMIAASDEPEYDAAHPMNCVHSYFQHEWIGNSGMYYMTKRDYRSKTFTDYTHSLAEIVGAMARNGLAVTDLREYEQDISGDFGYLDGQGFPLALLAEGRRLG